MTDILADVDALSVTHEDGTVTTTHEEFVITRKGEIVAGPYKHWGDSQQRTLNRLENLGNNLSVQSRLVITSATPWRRLQ